MDSPTRSSIVYGFKLAASRTGGYRDTRRDQATRKPRSQYAPGGRNNIAEGDWVCSDSSCSNVNFARRLACNLCGRDRYYTSKSDKSSYSHHSSSNLSCTSQPFHHRDHDRDRTNNRSNDKERDRDRDRDRDKDRDQDLDRDQNSSSSQSRDKSSSGSSNSKKIVGHEIGKSAAEKSRGLFSADDWQCGRCGNVNWARRQQCNMCNGPKFNENEARTGLGGGYNDRGQVEYIRREDSDSEYDDFGRKKKKFRSYDPHRKSHSSREDRCRDRSRSRSRERSKDRLRDKSNERAKDRSLIKTDEKHRSISRERSVKKTDDKHNRSRSAEKFGDSRDRSNEKNKSPDRHKEKSRYRERDRSDERRNSKSTRDGDSRSRRKSDSSKFKRNEDREDKRSSNGEADKDDSQHEKFQYDDGKLESKNHNVKKMNTLEKVTIPRPPERKDEKHRKFFSERDSTNQGDDDDDDDDDSDYSFLHNCVDDNDEEDDEDLSKYDLSDLVEPKTETF